MTLHYNRQSQIAFWGLFLLPLSCLHASERESVAIALKPLVKVGQQVLSVGDVADVYGGDSALARRIARLDILDCRDSSAPDAISQRQVRIRLLLDGIPDDSFWLIGAEQVEIGPKVDPVNDQLVIKEIHAALARRFQIPDSDLEVRLAQPLPAMPDLADVAPKDIELDPYLPDNLPRGKTRMKLALHVGDQLRKTLSVTVDIAEYREIAVAGQAIGRGQLLSSSDLSSERRPITGPVQYISFADAVGRETRRTFRPGEAIRTYDIKDHREEAPVLVKSRDTVRLVARKGRLAVTLSAAEALQQGRLGDVIRVRNSNSKRVIVGKVVGPGELEVRF